MQPGPEHHGSPPRPPVAVGFRAVSEAQPGPRWRRIFDAGWPGWSAWLGARGGGPAELARAERALRRFMPELAPVWERLVGIAGGDPRAARFLTFWSPPRYLLHCSQATLVDDDGPALIRNYDLDPALNEGALLRSAWLGRDVAGMVEGLSGLADGMNGAGLAVSLAFGGRPAIGPGFGVPLILRYVLEVCRDTPDALEALRALPCHMSYNLAIIDRDGRCATAMLAPDRPAIVTRAACSTNHQLGVEWPRHGRDTRTLERLACLEAALAEPGVDVAALRARFLAPPLHSRRYGAGFGTVYTATYRPAAGSVELAWPGLAPWRQRLDRFAEGERRILFADEALPVEAPAEGRAALPAAAPGPIERNAHP